MTDLTIFHNLDAMVASYERSRQLIIDGFASLAAARSEFSSHFALAGGTRNELDVTANKRSHHQIDTDPAHALLALRKAAWWVIVERLEMRRIMSIKAWDELTEQLEKHPEELPEITHDSVRAWGEQNINPRSLERMMRAAIVEVFEWLRPRGAEARRYKRNSELEVPHKLVLPCALNSDWGKYRVEWSQYRCHRQLFIALENVVHWLDGRGQVARAHKSDLEQAIEACTHSSNAGATEYFAFRCYRNRSLHLTWKRLDLLKRFNQIAGGARLRPTDSRGSNLATI